jgi:hypothetical protein
MVKANKSDQFGRRMFEMKATAIALLACLLVIALAVPCFAGQSRSYKTFAGGPKMALHIQSHNAKQGCSNLPAISTFGDIARMETGTGDFDVFMVVFDFGGVSGGGFTYVEYGLSWPGDWGSALTTHCGDLAIGGIVNPFDAIAVSWSACQTSPAFAPIAWSWLIASGPGQIQIEYRTGDTPFLGITDCAFTEIPPDSIFFAGVDVDPWEGEPDPEAVEATTWGDIKAMFR